MIRFTKFISAGSSVRRGALEGVYALLCCCFTIGFTANQASAASSMETVRQPPFIDTRNLASEGFRLTASLPEPTVSPGQAVTICLSLENVSTETLVITETSTKRDYRLIIIAPDGTARVVQRKSSFPNVGRWNLVVHMKPGQVSKRNFELDSDESFSVPGNYLITALGYGGVVSNTVVLKVLKSPGTESGETGSIDALADLLPPSRLQPAARALEHYGCRFTWDAGQSSGTALVSGYKVKVKNGTDILIVGNKQFKMRLSAKVTDGELWLSSDAISLIATLCAAERYRIPIPSQLKVESDKPKQADSVGRRSP